MEVTEANTKPIGNDASTPAGPGQSPKPAGKERHPSPEPAPKRIGERLIEAGLITEAQLAEALNVQSQRGLKVVEALISLGHVDLSAFARFLAKQPGIASIDLPQYEITPDLVSLVPKEFSVTHEVFPIDKLGNLLTLGMVCPLDNVTIKEIESITGLSVKPILCSPEDVRAAIKRYYPEPESGAAPTETAEESVLPTEPTEESVQALKSSLKLAHVAGLIRQVKTLPALPATVDKIREAVVDPAVTVADVADITARDPAMAAKLLSVANSAAYGFRHRVADLTLAISLLGLRETYGIVLSTAVVNAFDKAKDFNYEAFWAESLCCAAASRLVAQSAGRGEQSGVFSAGLLHDIGRLALFEVIPELYAKASAGLGGTELLAAEEEEVGMTHPEAGYELATHWNLPPELAEAIRFHHHPQLAEHAKDVVAIVSVADGVVSATDSGGENTETILGEREQALAVLGLDGEAVARLVEGYRAQREDMLQTKIF